MGFLSPHFSGTAAFELAIFVLAGGFLFQPLRHTFFGISDALSALQFTLFIIVSN